MNQQCKVCGEPAAGFHFGAFTCEGCKSFFGRTYNNLSSISECKNNGECVINKKNRTACKACRLRKCLLVGMSKSGSRYGRRSNWFKIHCLLQEQQQKATDNINLAMASSLRPPPYLPALFRTHQFSGDTRSSASDSGASSADAEEDVRIAKPSPTPSSDKDYFSGSSSKKLNSPLSETGGFTSKLVQVPTVSPNTPSLVAPLSFYPRWLPPYQGVGDPGAWRDLWGRTALSLAAAPAPDQDQPIDLSTKKKEIITKDGGETSKPLPLDLTLDR